MLTEVIRLTLFPAVMAFAASSDLLTMTIANRVSLALVGGFVLLAALSGASGTDMLSHAGAAAAVLAVAFFCFACGWIGGGDAKLAAATALWLGWTPLADYGLVSALAGGALTVVILFSRRVALPAFLASQSWIARLHNAKSGIPYGIALALGGMVVYPETQFWTLIGAR
jgi:prepilin peptidase CpaA